MWSRSLLSDFSYILLATNWFLNMSGTLPLDDPPDADRPEAVHAVDLVTVRARVALLRFEMLRLGMSADALREALEALGVTPGDPGSLPSDPALDTRGWSPQLGRRCSPASLSALSSWDDIRRWTMRWGLGPRGDGALPTAEGGSTLIRGPTSATPRSAVTLVRGPPPSVALRSAVTLVRGPLSAAL
mmetsp:Transcript_99556/g.281761  ORF Transcript_99556/g.281761 Transcript_99556/m.281761 type:complete len:187 (+) Transcript_99556:1148-1708(+)